MAGKKGATTRSKRGAASSVNKENVSVDDDASQAPAKMTKSSRSKQLANLAATQNTTAADSDEEVAATPKKQQQEATPKAQGKKKSKKAEKQSREDEHQHGEGDAADESTGEADESLCLSLVEWRAFAENFDLEVEDALKTYDDKCTLRWQALSRSVDATLASYHESVLALTTAIMCDVYGWDTDRALRDAVEQRIERPGLIDGEMNARKRKHATAATDDGASEQHEDEEKPQGATRKGAAANKRQKAAPAAAAKAQPTASTSKAGGARGAAPGSARPTRQRDMFSPTSGPCRSTRDQSPSDINFVYDANRRESAATLNPRLPPTPSLGTSGRTTMTARKPRRGESIVLMSINNSPLGVVVAAGQEGGDDASDAQSERRGEDDADDWDMMDRAEASRSEDVGKAPAAGKKGGKKAAASKGKVPTANSKARSGKASGEAQATRRTTRSRSSSLSNAGPTQSFAKGSTAQQQFTYEPPADAPRYDDETEASAMLARTIAQAKPSFDKLEMPEQEKRKLWDDFVASVMKQA